MSTNPQDAVKRSTKPHLNSVKAKPWVNKLKSLTDPKEIALQLYLDRDLTRDEFDAKVIELGYRAALRALAAQACNGDTKALDLFLRRCDQHFSAKRAPSAGSSDSEAAPYSRPQRETQEQ